MPETLQLFETPAFDEVYMIAGWRQWADAGSVSSGLPAYLVERIGARKIGEFRNDGFYLFQVPGTHDWVRPVVKFQDGFPISLDAPKNELYFAEDQGRGLVFLIGDEPHMDIDRYVETLLEAAKSLNVRRIIGLGGVYGELPYDKERMVSSVYSLKHMKEEMNGLAVTLSDYHGGASIGSVVCQRASEKVMEYVGLYAFVPNYDFSEIDETANSIRIETDFMAWKAVMQRINFMLKLSFNLTNLEERSRQLIQLMEAKVDEIDQAAPGVNVRAYLKRLSDEFDETPFNPADEFWEEELRRLFKQDGQEDEG